MVLRVSTKAVVDPKEPVHLPAPYVLLCHIWSF